MTDEEERALLESLADRYDHLPLECDGLTRVQSYCLARAGVKHQAWQGSVRFRGRFIALHCWLTTAVWVLDYRLRLWLGPEAPHGVFRPPEGLRYEGRPALLTPGPLVYALLAEGVPPLP
jgi:hypothetical protein